MRRSSAGTSTIVIDAGLAVWVVLPVVSPHDHLEHIRRWRSAGVRLVAPMLWLAECASAIRATVHTGMITLDEGRQAVEDILALEIETLSMTAEQTRAAFEWASRLGQRRVYDGIYLAVAEELDAELWTGDQRLVLAARSARVNWVHGVGERE